MFHYLKIVKPLNSFKGDRSSENLTFKLDLNFSRGRFFPQLIPNIDNSKTLFNSSLGIVASRFSKKKNFLNTKASYILTASYIRRILLNIFSIRIILNIVGTPLYLTEVVKTILNQTNSLYKSPYYNGGVVNEKKNPQYINFRYINFLRNKNFGVTKVKKVGRLKRKIQKKIKLVNNILD